MFIYVILAIIFCIFMCLSIYVITIYNKLKTYKNEVDKLWNSLRLNIESQFKFIKANIDNLNNVDKFYLKDYISSRLQNKSSHSAKRQHETSCGTENHSSG